MTTNRDIVILFRMHTADGIEYYATRDFKDASGDVYKSGLVEAPMINMELPDLYYGVVKPKDVRIQIVDRTRSWIEFFSLYDIRGYWGHIEYVRGGGSNTRVFRGKITAYEVVDELLTVTISSQDDLVFDTDLPKDEVTADDFHTTAMDTGQPINICVGTCRNVPCPNVKNDRTNNHYDYLIGYGPIQGVSTAAGQGVRRIGGTGGLADPVDYTILNNTTDYPGYAVIRFSEEQLDFGEPANYLSITADVNGLTMSTVSTVAERNFAVVIENIMTSTAFGLLDKANTAVFNQAATDLSTATIKCNKLISNYTKARDIVSEMTMVSQSYLIRDSSQLWCMYVMKTGSTGTKHYGVNDGFYNNASLKSFKSLPANEYYKSVTVRYDNDKYSISADAHDYAGIDKTISVGCVNDFQSGRFFLSRLVNRSINSYHQIELEVENDTSTVALGDIIAVHSTSVLEVDWIVEKKRTNYVDKYILGCREYSSSIYSTLTSISAPATITEQATAIGYINWTTLSTNATLSLNRYYLLETSAAASTQIALTMPPNPVGNNFFEFNDMHGNFGSNRRVLLHSGARKWYGATGATVVVDTPYAAGRVRYENTSVGYISDNGQWWTT